METCSLTFFGGIDFYLNFPTIWEYILFKKQKQYKTLGLINQRVRVEKETLLMKIRQW